MSRAQLCDELAEVLRDNVQSLMQRLGLNMKQFADMAGVSHGTVTVNFGNGKKFKAPSQKTIKKIEKAFSLPSGSLAKRTLDIPPSETKAAELPVVFTKEIEVSFTGFDSDVLLTVTRGKALAMIKTAMEA